MPQTHSTDLVATTRNAGSYFGRVTETDVDVDLTDLDATNQVVIPDTIDFTVGANAIDIGFAAAGTYRIYIGRMIG